MNKDQSYIDFDKNVDLSLLKDFVLRNKNLVIGFSSVFFALFCAYSFTLKRVWQGRFEIVIDSSKNEKPSLGGLTSKLSSMQLPVGNLMLGSSSSLLNEIGILESQSVLLPVFNRLNLEKQRIDSSFKSPNFFMWKNKNFKTELKSSTSILRVSYTDTDKELVIPVLQDISSTYQKYSGKNKRRDLELTQQYLDNQIEIYKDKSNNSLRNAQEFAFDQDLTIFGSMGSISDTGIEAETVSGISNAQIEIERVKAANKIKVLDAKIEEFEKVSDIAEINYMISLIPSLAKSNIITELDNVEKALVGFRYRYNEGDKLIQQKLEEKKILIDIIKERAIGAIKTEKIATKAILDANTRPKEVILKYKELIREAGRDEATLVQLEDMKRVITLDEAVLDDPWDLITVPYLERYPVAPRRKIYGFAGLIIGLFFGLIASYIKEKKSDIIFDEKIFESIFKAKILDRLEIETIKKDNLFIKEILKLNKIKNLRFITDESLDINQIQKINDLLIEEGFNISNSSLLNNFEDDEELILVAKSGQSTYKDLAEISNKLTLLEKQLFGLILIY